MLYFVKTVIPLCVYNCVFCPSIASMHDIYTITSYLIITFLIQLRPWWCGVLMLDHQIFCIYLYRYGAGTGPILLTQVQCGDDDNHILRCNFRETTSVTSRCTHNDDVAVVCCKLVVWNFTNHKSHFEKWQSIYVGLTLQERHALFNL